MTKLRVGVSGATGRMGKSIIKIIHLSSDGKLQVVVSGARNQFIGEDVGVMTGIDLQKIAVVSDIDEMIGACDVVIDFSSPIFTMNVLQKCVERKKPIVIGTTGLNQQQQHQLQKAAEKIPVIFSSNMSIGVNVLLKLLEEASNVLADQSDVEIIETHHRNKVDSPSGTAIMMGKVIAQSKQKALDEIAVWERHGRDSIRDKDTIGFSSVRAGDVVGDHTVLFALEGERIELTHKAHDRDIYARGAVQAAKWLSRQPVGFYTMQDVLKF